MKVLLSWLKEYIDLELPLEEIGRLMSNAGLELDSLQVVGLPLPVMDKQEFAVSGLAWEPDKIVVAQIDEVMPHPNADRLTLCRLNDGRGEWVVLTGAPNLFDYKGLGPLPRPLKVAYAREGARIYDGHQPGQVLTTLKRAKIRGVESFSMVCSEKELGISEEHEGIILLDDDAPTGMPLADYMGDAVFEISITPNMVRNASVMGVARELAALTEQKLRKPVCKIPMDGPAIAGQAYIEIRDPELNMRFVVGLVRGVTPQPSPYRVQRRLRLAGMRPINSVVDATNYVMLETGEPLHAFDYDVLVQRAGGKSPTIITRAAQPGEQLTTLDNIRRTLDDFTVLVCDTAGALSLAGVMGGLESEVTDATRNVLLEGASWNYVNVRRTLSAQKLTSEAGYRFSRGVHPALAEEGVRLGLERMTAWSGGQIAAGLVDAYPKPVIDPVTAVTSADVRKLLGINLVPEAIAALLERLEFACRIEGEVVYAQTPPHRLDIGEGVVGLADVLEEVARLYGYNNIPTTHLEETLPVQRGNPALEGEERMKDILVSLGLQEVIAVRQTHPEREAKLLVPGAAKDEPYVRLANPITPERSVMRRSVLASVVEIAEKNSRVRERLALFELGQAFWPVEGQPLPEEPVQLAIVMAGQVWPATWDRTHKTGLDFYDLKGVIEALLAQLHVPDVTFAPVEHATFHPGKCAQVKTGEVVLGVFGELHPLVKARFDFVQPVVVAAEIDVVAVLAAAPVTFDMESVPAYPPILEDIAIIVDESVPAGQIDALIRQTGGRLLRDVRLFDIFRGAQIGEGKKSMAYSLTYQAADRTLTDQDAAQLRNKIVRRLEQQLGAKLRTA